MIAGSDNDLQPLVGSRHLGEEGVEHPLCLGRRVRGIENIARKQIVNAVLSGDDTITIDAIHEACKCELFNNPTTRRIGF